MQDISPILMAAVLVIFMHSGQRDGTATAMLYKQNGKFFLVTAKHILEGMNGKCPNADQIKVLVHENSMDAGKIRELILPLKNEDGTTRWKGSAGLDIALVPLPETEVNNINQLWISVDDLLPDSVTLMAGEPIVVVGFPRGVADSLNTLPFAFSAGIASAFGIHVLNQPEFYIDRDLVEGMSGSPAFTKGGAIRAYKNQQLISLDENQNYFLGIHCNAKYNKERGDLSLSSITYASEIKKLASE
jgi:hypothetical protein